MAGAVHGLGGVRTGRRAHLLWFLPGTRAIRQGRGLEGGDEHHISLGHGEAKLGLPTKLILRMPCMVTAWEPLFWVNWEPLRAIIAGVVSSLVDTVELRGRQ